MPVKVLFVENDLIQQESFKTILQENLGINFNIINSFDLLKSELEKNDYTHLVSRYAINGKLINDFSEKITIPILITFIDTIEINKTTYNLTKLPLSYSKLFAFISEKPIISNETLKKYAMGDQEFINQIKKLIKEEFKANIELIPQLLENKDLKEIKSKVHQMVSKFSLLEMDNSYSLSKEIDLNILENPKKQIPNTQQLLVDIEIALTQLK